MSADPFANTTTVKNILQHIISPKIVSNGSGGYVTKTDLVNVHNLLFSERATTTGSLLNPLTAQCGTVIVAANDSVIELYHSRITSSSIILATCMTAVGTAVESVRITGPKSFAIQLLSSTLSNVTVSWFIAAF